LAAEQIQNEGAIRDGLAKNGEGVRHPLHLATVVVNGVGALREGTELGVEEHGAGFPVVEELLLEPEPGDASRDAIALVNVIQEVWEMVLKIQETTTQSMRDHAG
jgi:hypothetical protein